MKLTAVEIAARIEKSSGKKTPPPTEEQIAVIEAPQEPLLVIAGAGSGKTETMAARVVYLVANDIVPIDKVLGLTFTKKAAAELSDRVRKRLKALRSSGVSLPNDDLGLARPTVSTYNSYAASLVRDHALTLGIEPSSRLLTEAGQWGLASEVIEKWDGDLQTDRSISSLTNAILKLSNQCDEHLREPEELADFIENFFTRLNSIERKKYAANNELLYGELKPVVETLEVRSALVDLVIEYRRLKREREVIDYADQVSLAAQLVQSNPEVGKHERERFATVLLDEYQDTSHSQLAFLRAMFGSGHSVTAVGDPHQAIYGWRGASSGGLDRFPQDFLRKDESQSRVLTLSTSWRNDQAILKAANVLAGPLRQGSQVDVPELNARSDAGPGEVVGLMVADTVSEAQAIAEFLDQRRSSPIGNNERIPTCAVLCRKRSQFSAITEALRHRGVPVVVADLGGLLDAPEIMDIVSTLKVVHDPSQGAALVRLLTGPFWNIGISDLHALNAFAKELSPRVKPEDDDIRVLESIDDSSLVDALDALTPKNTTHRGRSISKVGLMRFLQAADMFRELRTQTYLPLPDLVRRVEVALGLDIEAKARGGMESSIMRQRLDAFRDTAASFTGAGMAEDHVTLGSFLSWLDNAASRENGLDMPIPDVDPEAVQIMTIHGAKGLEWDIVALPGMIEGTLPSVKQASKSKGGGDSDPTWTSSINEIPFSLRGDKNDLPNWSIDHCEDQVNVRDTLKQFIFECGAHKVKEERRLAYVGLTRARKSVLLIGSWWKDSNVTCQKPSRFIEELSEYEAISQDDWAQQPEDGEKNPASESIEEAAWPIDLLGERRNAIESVASDITERIALKQIDLEEDAPPVAKKWGEEIKLLLQERWDAQKEDIVVEIDARLSASDIVSLHNNQAKFIESRRRPMPPKPKPEAQRGSTFHAWVEDYYLKPASLFEEVEEIENEQIETIIDIQQAIENFKRTRWAGIKPVELECEVEQNIDGVEIIGRIDAIFEAPEGSGKSIEIVDWKTGQVPTDDKDALSRELQLAAYAFAWSRSKNVPLSEIAAVFYYADDDQIVTIDLTDDDTKLEERIRQPFSSGLVSAK